MLYGLKETHSNRSGATVGFLDKIKTQINGRGSDPYQRESLSDGFYDEMDDSYDTEEYVEQVSGPSDRGYSTQGYGRPGRGGLSDDDGVDYDSPSRTRYTSPSYGRDDSDGYDDDQPQGSGIPYRDSSSADSVHVVSRGTGSSYRRPEPPRRPEPGSYSTVTARPGSRRGTMTRATDTVPTGEMRIVRATRYEDIEVVSRYFCAGDTVALVLSNVKPEIGRRILDFSFGVVSALGGKVDHVFGSVFVLTHGTAGVSDTDRATLREQGLIE